jgi:hypothetical protein
MLTAARTIKPDDPKFAIGRNEYTGNVPPVVLTGSGSKPAIKVRLSARKLLAVVSFLKRTDRNSHRTNSTDQIAMSSKDRHQLLGGLRRIEHGGEKGVAIGASQHHALMLVEHPPRSLAGKIARHQR